MPRATIEDLSLENRGVYQRITRRLIPYLFLLYIVAYIDRVNVGFAAIDMKRQLNFSDTIYGTGAGMFFLGYAFFDIPSNLVMRRVGTRLWIARIMITWGVVAALMAFVHSPGSFYVMRFLLGVAEAGFVPGMLLYLTYWFPSHERARAVAKFMTATSLAGVFGGPLSSALLKLDGVGGLQGWQWLFIGEGIPTVLLGFSVLFVLRDGPQDAPWLNSEEKRWLASELERDRQAYGATENHSFVHALRSPALWMLIGVYVSIQIGVYIVNLWMPVILSTLNHSFGASEIARYSTIPYLIAAIATVIIGWSSDRWNERRGHLSGCMALTAIGFVWVAAAKDIPEALCAMTVAAIGLWSTMGPFWALMTRSVTGAAAAGGVAMITSLGAVGGFAGPYLTGRMKDATQSFSGGLHLVAVIAVVAAVLSLVVPQRRTQS